MVFDNLTVAASPRQASGRSTRLESGVSRFVFGQAHQDFVLARNAGLQHGAHSCHIFGGHNVVLQSTHR